MVSNDTDRSKTDEIVRSIKGSAIQIFERYPNLSHAVRSVLQPRDFRAYCIGPPKTGTHSIARVFKSYRSAHEPHFHDFAHWIEGRWQGTIGREEIEDWLVERDKFLWLECESSHPMVWFSDLIVDLFPESRFIVTIRDCMSWLDSIIDQHINYRQGGQVRRLEDLFYGSRSGDHQFDTSAQQRVYPLENYLDYWVNHYNRVLKEAVLSRAIFVQTKKITEQARILLKFVGADPTESPEDDYLHAYKAPEKHHTVDEIGRDRVRRCVERRCGNMIQKLVDLPQVDMSFHELVGR